MEDTRRLDEQALEIIRDQMAQSDEFGNALGRLICDVLDKRPDIAQKIISYSKSKKDMLTVLSSALNDYARKKAKNSRYAMEDAEAMSLVLKELGETEDADIDSLRALLAQTTTAAPPKAQTSADLAEGATADDILSLLGGGFV